MVTSKASSNGLKGQAATEFLVTYGWAIVIVLAIMAILYSTVFKPEFYVSERCDVAPGIACDSFGLTRLSDTQVRLDLQAHNTMGFEINLTSMGLTLQDSRTGASVTNNINPLSGISPATVDEGESFTVTAVFNTDSVSSLGSLYKINFTLNFTNNAVSSYPSHVTAGIINVRLS